MESLPAHIVGKRWIHSHEEDTPTEMVFRLENFPFPRSRGRVAFELRPDNSLVQIGIAPRDGPQVSQGKWQLSPDGKLIFIDESTGKPSQVLHIVSATEDRLTVQK
jgi:hypothetical protein